MAFDPSGLPTLPTCESDIARWAADLQTWLVTKLSTTHSEIDNVVIDPFDICIEVGNLSGPDCLVPADGVDTASFSYAPNESTALTPGVLPWPGSVLPISISRPWDVYTGSFGGTATNGWAHFTVNFPVPFATGQYFIAFEPSAESRYFYRLLQRLPGSFVVAVINGEPNYTTVPFTIIWAAFYYG